MVKFRKPSDDVLRNAVFEEESDILKLSMKKRRGGRPKLAWAIQVRKVAMMVSTDNLSISLRDEFCWKKRCGDIAEFRAAGLLQLEKAASMRRLGKRSSMSRVNERGICEYHSSSAFALLHFNRSLYLDEVRLMNFV